MLPGVAVLGSLLLGGLLSSISVPNHSLMHCFVFEGSSDDARNLLIGITGTIVTVIALVLGLHDREAQTRHRGAPGAGPVLKWSCADYLDLACTQVRRYGASGPTVIRELINLLDSTVALTDDPIGHVQILRQLDLMVDDAVREVAPPADLTDIHLAAKELDHRLSETARPAAVAELEPTVEPAIQQG